MGDQRRWYEQLGMNRAEVSQNPDYQNDPYRCLTGVPSNPAWRYNPQAARTPSPRPARWPPQTLLSPVQQPIILQPPLWLNPGVFRGHPRPNPPPPFFAAPVQVNPMPRVETPAVNAVDERVPKTPSPNIRRRRIISPMMISPDSDSLKSSQASQVTLGNSGPKGRNAMAHNVENLPFMVNPDERNSERSTEDSPSQTQDTPKELVEVTSNRPKRGFWGNVLSPEAPQKRTKRCTSLTPSPSDANAAQQPSSSSSVRVDVKVEVHGAYSKERNEWTLVQHNVCTGLLSCR